MSEDVSNINKNFETTLEVVEEASNNIKPYQLILKK